ncbi:MAG: hypothetical protein RLZZ344_116 [Pseudomonadota bacterium]|jgi:uncharacterized protein
MLTRILIVVVLVGLALWMLRRALGRPGQKTPPAPRQTKKESRQSGPKTLDLIACRHCGLHLPRSEAVWRGERSYCSEAHAAAHEDHDDAS